MKHARACIGLCLRCCVYMSAPPLLINIHSQAFGRHINSDNVIIVRMFAFHAFVFTVCARQTQAMIDLHTGFHTHFECVAFTAKTLNI